MSYDRDNVFAKILRGEIPNDTIYEDDEVLAFRDTLRSLRENRAILFSTHIIGDVEAISDRVLIIHQGRLLGAGRIQDLAERAGIPGAGLEEVFAHLVRTTAPTHV